MSLPSSSTSGAWSGALKQIGKRNVPSSRSAPASLVSSRSPRHARCACIRFGAADNNIAIDLRRPVRSPFSYGYRERWFWSERVLCLVRSGVSVSYGKEGGLRRTDLCLNEGRSPKVGVLGTVDGAFVGRRYAGVIVIV